MRRLGANVARSLVDLSAPLSFRELNCAVSRAKGVADVSLPQPLAQGLLFGMSHQHSPSEVLLFCCFASAS